MPLAEDVIHGDVGAAAQLITALEAGSAGASAELAKLRAHGGRAHVVGVTGAPGIGKSTLVASMVRVLRSQDKSVAVLAVDPSSPLTGGAILGDRIRMQEHAADDGVFIRSIGSRGAAGGISRAVAASLQVMDAMGKDVILIETVGAGQTEVDVHELAHTTALVLSADSGDSVQLMKAGIMEFADVFVVNKADRPGAELMVSQIKLMLQIKSGRTSSWKAKAFATDALSGKGVAELVDELVRHREFVRQTSRSAAPAGLAERPVREGLWKLTDEGEPRLIGSECGSCTELYFPKRAKGICPNCQNAVADIALGPHGRIYSFTTVMQRPPIYYQGPVPYTLAWVELTEGLRVEALLTGLSADGPKIGMPVRLIVGELHRAPDGTVTTTYKFTPVAE
jgi:LAO/AO transport system kinase